MRAIDPHPGRVWPQTLSGWARQLPPWLGDDVVASRSRPVLRTPSTRPLRDDYLVLDNAALQQALPLDGVTVEQGLVHDAGLRDLRRRARVVVDARGVGPAGHRGGGAAQTAYGVVVDAHAAGPALDGAQAVLMDWRPFDGSPRWGGRVPTFLYAIPVAGGVLLEETALAADPPLADAELRQRLLRRLDHLGVAPAALEGRPVEHVRIPLRRIAPAVVPRFGAAGAQLNPISGYSAFASLAAVDGWVTAVAEDQVGSLPDAPAWTRRVALGAVLRLPGDDVVSLFDGFAQLSPAQQAAVLDADAPVPAQLAAMTVQWARMPLRGKAALVRATAGR